METILIKCPHCKEEMQAPADRESILCMFCGEKIDLVEVRKTVPESEKTTDMFLCFSDFFISLRTANEFRMIPFLHNGYL